MGYDVVVLDVMLPGIDGLETCRRLRAGGVCDANGKGRRSRPVPWIARRPEDIALPAVQHSG